MSRLFISHSSKDSVAAVAFKQWLGKNGWAKDDVFLDVDDIGAGERWKEALRKGKFRCEAIILLASPEALDSRECLAELRTAEDYGKEIIVVLLRDLAISDERLQSYLDRQIVDLSAAPQAHGEKIEFRGTQHDVFFNSEALLKVKDYLFKRGITPDSFAWPPENKPDAEPFPGLSAFTEDDAGIFFGRESDVLIGQDELRLLRRNRSPRILAIQAASGAGKSSFLRAGLWPRLCRDPDYAPLAIVRPAGGILTGPEGLTRKLAPRLSRPGAPVNPGDINTRLMAVDAAKTVAEFASLMTKAAAQANEERRIVNPAAPPPALLIGIDQAEELLAQDDAAESKRFLELLAGLTNNPPEGVEPLALLTVRSDNAARLFQALADHKIEPPKSLMLLPVPQTSYRDVICKPLEVAARGGQQLSINPALIDRLVSDATGADALPLLAFTLSYLYQSFAAGGALTLDQYLAIGGIAGSIDKAVKQALAKPGDAPVIPAAAEDQLACLRATFIPWLADVDPQSGQPRRRVAKLDDFVGATRAMVDRLVKARLLIVDRREGADVVDVAHESLLRQWPALTEWLHAVAEDLGVVASVDRAAREWDRNGRNAAWLDHRADRLSAAERVAAREDFRRRLGATGIEYLKACRARETRQRRIAQTIAWSVAAVFAIFSVLLFGEWRQTVRAQRTTEASLLVAKSALDLQNDNVATAAAEAAQAFKSVPTAATRSALLQAAMEISPHAAAVLELGKPAEVLAWTFAGALDFVSMGQLDTFTSTGASKISAASALPVLTRRQDGNPAAIRALAALDAGRLVAMFDEGTVALYRPGGDGFVLQRPEQDVSINATQHSVAISHDATLIAVATANDTIIIYHCDWSAPAPAPPACRSEPFGTMQGAAVAISPDGKRIAVGDRAGNVAVYDPAANPIGKPQKFDEPINALGWAAERDWLAVGTLKGEIAVVDAGVDSMPVVQRETFGDNSISALAWSSNAPILAFVCNTKAVCVWQAETKADPPIVFKPAMRFEGHLQLITRLSFAPDGTQLASGATDSTIRIWNLQQNADVTAAIYANKPGPIGQLAVSPDRHWIAGGTTDGKIQIWDAQTGAPDRVMTLPDGPEVEDLAWNRTGAVAAIDENGTVHVIPADAAQPATKIPVKNSAGRHIAWADGDRLIALPLSDKGFILLDPQAPNAEPVRLGATDKQAWGVAPFGDDRLLVSFVGGDIVVWDLVAKQQTGSAMRNPQTAATSRIGVGSLAVSPDRRLLATSSGDRFVTVYNIAERNVWQTLPTASDAGIQTVGFSPDGQKLAALGNDKRLYIWTVGQNGAVLDLDVGVVPRHAIVGDAARRSEYAGWLGWIANDRVAVATGIAAINVIAIDPAKWLSRIDSLAPVRRGQ